MRVRSALKVMQLAVANYRELDARFGLTVTADSVIVARRDAVRRSMEQVLPGCSIGMGHRHINVSLPTRYTSSGTPIMIALDWYWINYLRGDGWKQQTSTAVALRTSKADQIREILEDIRSTNGESHKPGTDTEAPPF